MLRSRLRPVFSIEPCVNRVRTEPTREPRPILPTSPPASAEIRSANSTRAPLKPVVPTFAMLLPMTDSAAPLLMRPLRPVDSAPKIAIPASSSGVLVYLSHLVERDRVAAHQQRRRVGREVDAVHRRLREQAERRRRGLALLRRRDLEPVAAVGQHRAERALAVEGERMLSGALRAEVNDADGGAVGRAHGRRHLVSGLGHGVAHRRGLPALHDERAAVEADALAEQVQERGAAAVLRLACQLVEAVVHAGQLLELRELRELRGQLVGLERRERVLMLELRDEQLQELLLVEGLVLRHAAGRGGGRDVLEKRAGDAAEAHRYPSLAALMRGGSVHRSRRASVWSRAQRRRRRATTAGAGQARQARARTAAYAG